MKLQNIVEQLNLVKVNTVNLEEEILYGYTCDLLSEVMGKAKKNSIWITIQTHTNIIAVATLVGIKAIIIASDKVIPDDTVAKAKDENIALFKTELNQFEVSGMLYGFKIR